MTSLPREVPDRLGDDAHTVSAYKICLRLEDSLQKDMNNEEDVSRKMIYCRILGYFIHFTPSDEGLKSLVQEIVSCATETSLLDVGMVYFDYIRGFTTRAKQCRTPTTSNHEYIHPRPSFDTLVDMKKATFVDTPQSHADAKMNALIRDGFRCVVTGFYDWRSVRANRELIEVVESDPDTRTAGTECAHIFAESTNLTIATDSEKGDYAGTMFPLTRFGHDEHPKALKSFKVHNLENVMTLCFDFRNMLDDLDVWFVATVRPT